MSKTFPPQQSNQLATAEFINDVTATVAAHDATLEQHTAQLAAAPRGVLAEVSKTSGALGSGAAVFDLAGLTVTATLAPKRRYRLTAGYYGSGAVHTGQITDSANAIQAQDPARPAGQRAVIISRILTGPTGAVTFKVRCAPTGGTATVGASANDPAWLVLEDVGAVPA
jgi:hypothetical protein